MKKYEIDPKMALNLVTKKFKEFQKSGVPAKHFIDIMLTDTEVQALANRVLILQKLKQGGDVYAKIAGDLGVGVATVTHGAKVLRHGDKKTLEVITGIKD